ncbi:uncharacterized protein LOC133728264 [Rosa rugosa]|uniref:uncharacterized protein LOC133728264 n=1 Tax=Rosa rugosa TaxID=74645 RepID=UPI002B409347|nr:uncharacterized protein LOC133728264 [Rosa rugosa]XP_062011647.1 uncharacterized protein LOC133728264 [Rosa rugosa]
MSDWKSFFLAPKSVPSSSSCCSVCIFYRFLHLLILLFIYIPHIYYIVSNTGKGVSVWQKLLESQMDTAVKKKVEEILPIATSHELEKPAAVLRLYDTKILYRILTLIQSISISTISGVGGRISSLFVSMHEVRKLFTAKKVTRYTFYTTPLNQS